jgi:TetR/AcrR family transcriptional regulator, transcriptional repressor for nem operon
MTSASPPTASNGNKLSTKGLTTRQHIIEISAELMLKHGVEATTLEMIQNEAGVSPSQLYHYFSDKHAIVLAVLDYQTESVLAVQRQGLAQLRTFADLYTWRDIMVHSQQGLDCAGGCPIGSLTNQVGRTDHIARQAILRAMNRWESTLQTGLETMRKEGVLQPRTPARQLAVTLLATVQGGLLLTDIHAATTSLEVALNTVIEHIASYRVDDAPAMLS